ncbi:MAG: type II secretion system F family protein [Candidatus Eisenbacteria bacterium]|nr:type II secretion system F family protein [Candidatus Eisenbacteria bacterium]
MGSFAYIARSTTGEEVSGFLPGSSADEVVDQLQRQGLAVLHVVEDRSHDRERAARGRPFAVPFMRPGTRDQALFNRQLATLLEAGIPLVRGLRGLAADCSNGMLARAIEDLATRIERGESLSEAMAAHPATFNTMYLSMVRAGERAGTLSEIVEQLAVYMEKVDGIQNKVRAAMSYPVFVLIFAVAVTLFLLLQIVPTFQKIYSDFGQQLPVYTAVVIGISNAIRQNALLSLGVVAGLVVLAVLGIRTRAGRLAFDGFLLRVPLFGPIVRKAVMSRFTRTFGILTRTGLPILESLDLVSGAAGNAVVGQAILDVKERVAAGRGITESFRATGTFPELVLQLMATGEETGNLDAMMLKSSDFYDREVEAAVHWLSSLIEPVMIILVGAMVGAIVIAMFLPIFSLGDAIMRGGYSH